MENRPKIKLRANKIYNRIYLQPACEKSIALMSLLSAPKGPRQHIDPNEMPLLSQMGFDVQIVGHERELRKEIKRLGEEINYEK